MNFRRLANSFWLLAVIALVGVVFFWPGKLSSPEKIAVAPAADKTVPASAVAAPTPSAPEPARREMLFAMFQKRPFAVTGETGNYAWTTNDGRQPQFILELAHNELEYQRMMDENSRIYRRQLVYHKGAFSLAAQAARLGQPVSKLTLPGLDGQELHMEVLKSEFEAGGDRGSFSGRLPGREDSLVTIAFAGGREAFTVVSPADNLNLVAEPREPGELVVKSIIPELYGGSFGADDAMVTAGKK